MWAMKMMISPSDSSVVFTVSVVLLIRLVQMQVMEQTDGDPENSFVDTRNCSPVLTEPQTPMDADKASIYR